MELFSVTISGFRKIARKATLRTNGKALALVGPNEAGKSSVLDAIRSLGNSEAFEVADVSRGMGEDDLEIVGRFLLDDDELEVAGLSGPSWLQVYKEFSGRRSYGFVPSPPARDTSHRVVAIDTLVQLLGTREFGNQLSADLLALLKESIEQVRDAGSDMDAETLKTVRSAVSALKDLTALLPELETLVVATRLWTELAEIERAPNPVRRAINSLHDRVPTILFFDEDARNLASTYSIQHLRQKMPRALQSLLVLADLRPDDVFAAIDANDTARLTTLEHRANRTLERSFKEAWRQSGIAVALRLTLVQLDIQVINEQSDFTPLAERSDGLRQFVALHSFISISRADRPVLLIDEAEQKLHYDAQADLVQMLTRQRVASKVIFTTHSAGCLPEDLGHGVRLVQPCTDDVTCSAIVNKFWAQGSGGFSPLLFGMGATTLAFFPTRHAVCVEGPGDMLLYPTMFREALKVHDLGFQVVPNLSSAARGLMPLLPEEASGIAFLVDGDNGGLAIRESLLEEGLNAERIIILGESEGLELEDFVAPELLLRAANSLINRHHSAADPLGADVVAGARRMAALEQAYANSTGVALPKVELAYELLDLLDVDPSLHLLDAGRSAELKEIALKVMAAVGA
ncbi:AAA family ATPase [Sphingomonas sp. LR60]|uniref:AAA family ATPase n=1 Tax=Sphingomonas sp. LR60 TaxID=3050233 RepID=UPI002FE07BDC